MQLAPLRGGPRAKGRAGLTLIEVSISVVISTVLMLATAAAFSQNIQAIGQARRTSDATLFLGTSLESVAAVDYADLLALDGNQLFEASTLARSNYTVDLTAFQVEVGLIQVRAILSDRRSGREMARSHLLRSAR